ncbi:MAG: phosphoglucosamine mutase [Verrucomicrobiota bacterium JB022]|nr:phosphoglucosamine mutase [Verrucomicrobiota bacterium JB022]
MKYFGTDGIRGAADSELLAPAFVRRFGRALALHLRDQHPHGLIHVVVGRDPRASGHAISQALMQGLAMPFIRICDCQVAPTPAVALAVKQLKAAAGVVVTASHNPASDNGLKLFAPGGVKWSEVEEAAFEARIDTLDEVSAGPLPPVYLHDARRHYRQFAEETLGAEALYGMVIALDAANGATALTTREVLESLGARVYAIGVEPDGQNINDGVGSEHPERLAEIVQEQNARLGIAHDGDGDRLVLVDEHGQIVDGDALLGLLARELKAQDRLAHDTLVTTSVSNLGLDLSLKAHGIKVVRVGVGDRLVFHEMQRHGYTLGGENSGHLIIGDRMMTGDGLGAALEVLKVMRRTGRPLSELARDIELLPQLKANLRVQEKVPLDQLPDYEAGIQQLEAALAGEGRILVRYSGTEPKIRLLVEAKDPAKAQQTFAALKELTAKHLKLV